MQEAGDRKKANVKAGYLCIAVIVFLCLFPLSLPASDLSPIGNNALKDFEPVYSKTDPGVQFTVIGRSVLTEKILEPVSRAQLFISSPVTKAFLMWSGEVKGERDKAGEIRFVTPKGMEHPIHATRIWEKNSTGILYSALADVTQHVAGSGSYGVRDLRSDPVNPHGKDPYSVAGWALVVITQDRKIKGTDALVFLAGLQVLKPGETYDLALHPYLPPGSWEPRVVGMIGGHGRAGNGSGNLLNGRALSGDSEYRGARDTWNGEP